MNSLSRADVSCACGAQGLNIASTSRTMGALWPRDFPTRVSRRPLVYMKGATGKVEGSWGTRGEGRLPWHARQAYPSVPIFGGQPA